MYFQQILGYFGGVLKRYFIPYLYILIFLWNFSSMFGQKLSLKISAKDSLNSIIINTIPFQQKYSTEIALIESLDAIKNKLVRNGFFNIKIDTIVKTESIYHAKLLLGEHNKTIRIYYNEKNISKKQLFNLSLNVNEGYFDIDISRLSKTLNAIVGIFEKQGASFTEVSLDRISFQENNLEAHLLIKNSNLRKIDKIIINGYNDFPKKFLKHYLQLKNEISFNKEKLNKVSSLIDNLPFVSETKPPEVLFTKDSTIVYLTLQKKVANSFDGLIGFTSKEHSKGLSFNGYLDITLRNLFNSGETFILYWKNNGDDRQILDISLNLPYMFNSKLSPNATLNIYRQDSTFTTTKVKFTLPYMLNAKNSIGLSIKSERSSNLLTSNANRAINDYIKFLYGINYNYQILNNSTLFPIKLNLKSEILTGKSSVNSSTIKQSQLLLKLSYLWNINTKHYFFLKNNTGLLFGHGLVTNELFRIGGVNSIRGFSEENISTSKYSYLNMEYRYTPNNTSYLYSITDFGYFNTEIKKQQSENINQKTKIIGIGLGYAFKTKIGLFNISYALGKFSTQPFDFSNSKLHIKVTSFF